VRAYLRSLDPGVSRELWPLLSGSFANAFGNGVVFPFVLIYLHNVRGISLGVAGLAIATAGVASLVAGPVAGALIDRAGRSPASAATRSSARPGRRSRSPC
jgi:MFS family permease